jgi:hypothetical protein
MPESAEDRQLLGLYKQEVDAALSVINQLVLKYPLWVPCYNKLSTLRSRYAELSDRVESEDAAMHA